MPPRNLPFYFCAINLYLFSVHLRLVVCTSFFLADIFSRSLGLTTNDVNDDCSPPNTRMCRRLISTYEAKICFLWLRGSDFTTIFNRDVYFTWLFHTKNVVRRVFVIFSICMLMRKGRPVWVFNGQHLSLPGWKLKLFQLTHIDLDFGRIEDR